MTNPRPSQLNPDHLRLQALLAEFENERRRQRLIQATRAKARAGHAVRRPPTGYVADRSGQWQMDPYPGVRETITRVFADFQRLGTIGKVLKFYLKKGICLPVRQGHIVRIDRPSADRIHRILTNPAFMGSYVFGRRGTKGGGRRGQPDADGVIVVPGHHKPYVPPKRWKRIQAQLRRNGRSGR